MNIETFDDLADSLWLLACIGAKNGTSPYRLSSQWAKNVINTYTPDSSYVLSDDTLEEKVISNSEISKVETEVTYVSSDNVFNKEPVKRIVPPGRRFVASRVTHPKAKSIDIQRTLMPLKRRVASPFTPPVIDIEATINRYAEEVSVGHELGLESAQAQSVANVNILNPVVRQGSERWLNVVIIIDKWDSMLWWEEDVDNYKGVLEQSGVFQRVDVWELHTVLNNEEYFPRFIQKGLSFTNDSLEKSNTEHLRLLDPSGRTVFILLSDCISPVWDNWNVEENSTGIGRVLYDWGKYHPVSIVQLMPKRLWSYSGLGSCELNQASASFPVSPNISLNTIEKQENFVPIPVMLIDPNELSTWANLVAGHVDKPIACIYISPHQSPIHDSLIEKDKSPHSFLKNASFASQQLASYLMFSVLSHEVSELKIFCKAMMKEYRPDLFAELSLFGVLRASPGHKEKKLFFVKTKEIVNNLKKNLSNADELWIQANVYNILGPKQIDNNGTPFGFWELQSLKQNPLSSVDTKNTGASGLSLSNRIIDTETEKKDNLEAFQVESPNFEYLRHQPLHISLWGESNSGKTWLIKSLSRHLFTLGKTSEKLKFSISRIDHYGNTHIQSPIQFPKDKPTNGIQDHLFLFSRALKNGLYDDTNTAERVICFHDFAGANCIELPGYINTIYKYSDAIFLCLDFTDADNDEIRRHSIRTNLTKFLNGLNYYKNLRYLAVCVMKKDKLLGGNQPWNIIKNFVGNDVVQLLQNLPKIKSKAFLVSSIGGAQKSKLSDEYEWEPEGVASPFFWVLESENPQPKQGYLPYPED